MSDLSYSGPMLQVHRIIYIYIYIYFAFKYIFAFEFIKCDEKLLINYISSELLL